MWRWLFSPAADYTLNWLFRVWFRRRRIFFSAAAGVGLVAFAFAFAFAGAAAGSATLALERVVTITTSRWV